MNISFAILLGLASTLSQERSENPIERQEERIYKVESVDQLYLEEITYKEALPSRLEKTRNEFKDNPRNAGFAASFGSVSSNPVNN